MGLCLEGVFNCLGHFVLGRSFPGEFCSNMCFCSMMKGDVVLAPRPVDGGALVVFRVVQEVIVKSFPVPRTSIQNFV